MIMLMCFAAYGSETASLLGSVKASIVIQEQWCSCLLGFLVGVAFVQGRTRKDVAHYIFKVAA
jgi:hypothetical protein